MTVVLRLKVRNVTAAADSDQRVDRFRKRDVAPGEAVCVMRDQQYLHPVPHIRPFGMVVRLFSKHRDPGHEPEGGIEIRKAKGPGDRVRSEEHTSELQSLMRISYAVFCLKKKIYK